ncbi:MAG: nitroreductase [Klebsiella oxytoca]|nr:nitroreductase [Klebsiella oxytoca]
MDKNFTPEQIEIINRVVFARVEQMKEQVTDLIAQTERDAHQQLADCGIDMTDFCPANQHFLMMTIVKLIVRDSLEAESAADQSVINCISTALFA